MFLLFSAFVPLLIGVGEIGRGYAALGNQPSSSSSSSRDFLFLVPLALAWLTAIIPATPLMWVVAILFAPYAVFSLVLLFVAPPFGVPGCIVFGVWYSYFFALRRFPKDTSEESF